MSDNVYVTQLLDLLQGTVVCLAPLPNGCACRWAPWTARRLRRQAQAVAAAAAALYRILEAAESELDELLHDYRCAAALLAPLLRAADVPDAVRYRAYAAAWLAGLTPQEAVALRRFFGCTYGALADHITHWAFPVPKEAP
jgi:hypothetical protein